MKVENLEIGMTIKNYKDLCGLLEIKATNGNIKVKQIRLLESVVDFDKVGNSFVIKDIGDIDEFQEMLHIQNTISEGYIEDIEVLILNMLANVDNDTLIVSESKVFRELQMVNRNYHECKIRIPKLSSYLNISDDLITEWYSSANSMLKRNLIKALDNLDSSSLLKYNKIIMVCEQTPDTNTLKQKIIVDEYDEEIIKYYLDSGCTSHIRPATHEEVLCIMKYEKEYKEILGVSKENEIIALGQWDRYCKYVCGFLLEKYNISYYYDAYEIVYIGENVKVALAKEIVKIKNADLNHKIYMRIENNIENKISLFNRKLFDANMVEDILVDENEYTRGHEEYANNNKKLTDNLISIDANSIAKDVKKRKVESDGISKYKKIKL